MDSSAAHLEHLRDKHQGIEKMITAEMKHRAPDNIRLMELKKEKLKLKEEIIQFE